MGQHHQSSVQRRDYNHSCGTNDHTELATATRKPRWLLSNKVPQAISVTKRVNITLGQRAITLDTRRVDARRSHRERTLAGQGSQNRDNGVDHKLLAMSTRTNSMAKYCVTDKPQRKSHISKSDLHVLEALVICVENELVHFNSQSQ